MGEKLNISSSSILGTTSLISSLYSGVDANTVTVGCSGTVKYDCSSDDISNFWLGDFNAHIICGPKVKKIIKNGPATIVFWIDNTKTVVKRKEGAEDDIYVAFCAALAKKMYGTNSKVNKMLRTLVVDETEKED